MVDRDYKAGLNAFLEFLVDYYGVKLWRSCVKHKNNRSELIECL